MEQSDEAKPQQLLLTIEQAAHTLGLCRAQVYKLIARNGLPTIHFGRAVRVPVASLQKWIEEWEKREQSA